MHPLIGSFAAYLQAELRLSRATVSVYALEARLLAEYWAGRPFSVFTSADLIEYLVHRQLEGASRKTTAKSLSALRAFFAFLLVLAHPNAFSRKRQNAPHSRPCDSRGRDSWASASGLHHLMVSL